MLDALGATGAVERSQGPVNVAAHRAAHSESGVLRAGVGLVRSQVEQVVLVGEIDAGVVARGDAVTRVPGNRVAEDIRLRVAGDEDPAPVSNGGPGELTRFIFIPNPQAVLLLAACRTAKSGRLLAASQSGSRFLACSW